ncbi:MAG: DUF1134 domain-containing protein [Hyphomicrobiaceae bacterium]
MSGKHIARALALASALLLSLVSGAAQERLPWEDAPPSEERYQGSDRSDRYANRNVVPDSYSPNGIHRDPYVSGDKGSTLQNGEGERGPGDAFRQPRYDDRTYDNRVHDGDHRDSRERQYEDERGYTDGRRGYEDTEEYPGDVKKGTYTHSEIVSAGHRFFGSLSRGLARAVEYAFKHQGRPTGYILGEDAGGAFIAGVRYGEGLLHTKYGDTRRVYWQGPSIGYDFGGEGTRTMVLVYNLGHPAELFERFVGIQGSAYVVGGASVQILKHGNVTLAPIRTGLGLRLGANVGYLKYTRRPTWNPF